MKNKVSEVIKSVQNDVTIYWTPLHVSILILVLATSLQDKYY